MIPSALSTPGPQRFREVAATWRSLERQVVRVAAKDAEIEAHRSDADWCQRFVPHSGLDLRILSDDAGYLECRGLAPTPSFAQALSREVDAALRQQELLGCVKDLDDALRAAACIGELDRLTGCLPIRHGWGSAGAHAWLGRWWMGVARGDAATCEAARQGLAGARAIRDAPAWEMPPRLLAPVLEALDAADERRLHRSLVALLREHDERARPLLGNVVGDFGRTAFPLLTSRDAMAFIAEARRRGMRVELNSPYLAAAFRAPDAGPPILASPPKKVVPGGVPMEAERVMDFLRSIETRLGDGGVGKDDVSTWTFAAELALRRALLSMRLDVSKPEHVAYVRSTLVDFMRLATDAATREREAGRVVPDWLLAMAVEASIISRDDAVLERVWAAGQFDPVRGADAAAAACMRLLATNDVAHLADALRILAASERSGEDALHVRRFDPVPLARGLSAIVAGDATPLRQEIALLLAWHDVEAQARPRGRSHATTPEDFLVSLTCLALLELARRRGMTLSIDSPYVPAALLHG